MNSYIFPGLDKITQAEVRASDYIRWLKGGFITVILLLLTSLSYAQSVKLNTDGNYTEFAKPKDTVLKWSGHTYTDKTGKVYQVYVSPKANKLFIVRTSKKSGNNYKQYLKIEN